MRLNDKIIARRALSNILPRLVRPLVFTNGVFDLIHPGHVIYLEQARLLGNSLVVGVNSNSSARLLEKGTDRPINMEADRAILLAALESVSLVCIFEERKPLHLIEEVRPDIYVKGADYDVNTLEEAALVRSWGGRVDALPFVSGYSTTRLLARIRQLDETFE